MLGTGYWVLVAGYGLRVAGPKSDVQSAGSIDNQQS